MKTISIILLTLTMSLTLSAQGEYEKAMGEAMEKFGSVQNVSDMQATAAMFERIAEVETGEWLPSYYASFINCILSFQAEDPVYKGHILEEAEKHLNEALQRSPRESELYILQGMIYSSYITLDPAVNGGIYSPKANGAYQTAIALDPENPRAHYMLGTLVLYTPEEFGGGKKAALPEFEKAMELYEKESSTGPFMPSWGREECENNLKNCREGV